MDQQLLATSVAWFSGWSLHGNATGIDLIAASTGALNGALLARRPDHYKNFTVVGILLMALLGGLGGGITRDILLNHVPSALTNPAYITFCLVAGAAGYLLAYGSGQLFREGLFQFSLSFMLPWFAIVGVQKAVDQGIPVLGALLIGIIAPTAGRAYIDIVSGVSPKQFIQGEWFIGTAFITSAVWVVVDSTGAGSYWSAGIAFAVGFTFRVAALYRGWEEPLAREPKGAYKHSDGRPLLGRKLAGKSQRELHELGLVVENGSSSDLAAKS